MIRVALLSLLLVGCCHRQQGDLLPPPIESLSPMPSVERLVERYNANIEPIQRLWARTDVTLRWRDDKGKNRLEKGEGVFMFVRPDNIAFTLGKLGETGLWAGSNDERYWLFDLREDVAYVGRHENVGKPGTQPLPLAIYPSEVPYLLGLMPLGESVLLGERRGYAVLQPVGTNLSLMIDPHTARPARIDVIRSDGTAILSCRLSKHKPIETIDQPRQDWPLMSTLAEMYVPGREAHVKLKLSHLTDGVRRNRIKDRAFDFDALVNAHKPKRVENLDQTGE